MLHVKPFEQPKTDQAVENQEDRDHQIEQPRHDQDQQACNHRHDRRNVSDGQGHLKCLRYGTERSNRGRHFIRWRGSPIGDAGGLIKFPRPRKKPKMASNVIAIYGERCSAR